MIVTTDRRRVVKPSRPPKAVEHPSTVHDQLRTALALAAGDVLGIVAVVGTAAILTGTGLASLGALAAVAITQVLVFVLWGLYPGLGQHSAWEFRKIMSATVVAFVPFLLLSALPGVGLPATAIIVAFGLMLVVLPFERMTTRKLCSRASWWGCPVALFGDRRSISSLWEKLKREPGQGLRPVAAVQLHDLYDADLAALPTADRALVILAGSPLQSDRTAVMARLEAHFNEVTFLDPLFSSATGEIWGEMRNYVGVSGVSFRNNLNLRLPRAIKRAMDIALSLTLIIALLPLLGLISLLVKLQSSGRLIYGHERIGRGGRRFRAWKFRTMVADADIGLRKYLEKYPDLAEQWRTNQKLENDPRVTRIGQILRKLSLDELPQLWNVLVGEMSLVGPRPIVLSEIGRYAGTFEKYLQVTPGITGLWQVSGRNNTTYPERVAMDDFYVRNWSPWFDAYLMFRTVRTVLTAEGAS